MVIRSEVDAVTIILNHYIIAMSQMHVGSKEGMAQWKNLEHFAGRRK